ncbi:unnamed protein product, partial [marine sediment metagenome]
MIVVVKGGPILCGKRSAEDKNHREKSKYNISVHLFFALTRIVIPEIRTSVL